MNKKIIFLPLAILLLLPFTVFQPQEAYAAITIDADEISFSSFGGNANDPNTFDHQVDAGSDVVLVVVVSVESGEDADSVTWGVTPLTEQIDTSFDGVCASEIWSVALGDVLVDDSRTISIGNPEGKKMTAGAIAFYGVDQSNHVDNTGGDSSDSQDPSITIIANFANSMSVENLCTEQNGVTAQDEQAEHWETGDPQGNGFTDLLGGVGVYTQDLDKSDDGKKHAYSILLLKKAPVCPSVTRTTRESSSASLIILSADPD